MLLSKYESIEDFQNRGSQRSSGTGKGFGLRSAAGNEDLSVNSGLPPGAHRDRGCLSGLFLYPTFQMN